MALYIPVLGRLSLLDYFRLFFAFTLLFFEAVFRVIFAIFPPLRWLANLLVGTGYARKTKQQNPAVERSLENLHNTEDFVRYWGYPFQHHYTTTKDGYILALHRIPSSKADFETQNRTRFASAPSRRSRRRSQPPQNKPVVLLWHGFLMCSEVWVCTSDPKTSLAFTLAEAGYDVWLGNTRGNKYSCKHNVLKSTDETYWDFSIDHLALYDLPDAVEYILKVTGAPSLSYIGFSQGTAQGFSSLSINQALNNRINLFIALAPAAKPSDNRTVSTMINTSPDLLYLLFGRKSLLSSALFWQSIFSAPTWAWLIDHSTRFLFSWTSDMVEGKSVVYRHLYSFTSVKCVVHWFQIIRNGRFQMYDENPAMLPGGLGHVVPKFPTEHIRTPIALFYGGKDTLADMDWLLNETATPVYCLKVEGIEKAVFPGVLGLLAQYAETRSDPSSSSASLLDDIRSIRSVPWIHKSQIDTLLELGQGRLDSTGRNVIFEGKVSAKRLITAGSMPKSRQATMQLLDGDIDAMEAQNSPPFTQREIEEMRDAVVTAMVQSNREGTKQVLITENGKGGGRRQSGSATKGEAEGIKSYLRGGPGTLSPLQQQDGAASPWSEGSQSDEENGDGDDEGSANGSSESTPTLRRSSHLGLVGMVPGDSPRRRRSPVDGQEN
ncbi:hypothetical protein HK104_001442 [Borealophlyctis nickersoniae]|nr:hypothetical protein HK104_001442 [Borealophlyctis nickersoniae]